MRACRQLAEAQAGARRMDRGPISSVTAMEIGNKALKGHYYSAPDENMLFGTTEKLDNDGAHSGVSGRAITARMPTSSSDIRQELQQYAWGPAERGIHGGG